MSDQSVASPRRCDALPIPKTGAAVLRLRTRAGAQVRGHALLIGSPFAGLGGVADCLERVAGWLGPGYELVEGPLEPTKANIQAQFECLARRRDHDPAGEIETGDQVLVYYAGHGKQGLPRRSVHDRPVTVLLPIDARGPTPASSQLVLGHELVQWLDAIADACGAPDPQPVQRVGASTVEATVTMILECCHSAGLAERWPTTLAARDAIVDKVRRQLWETTPQEHVVRGGKDPLPRVVRVMASGRDEWAQGPTVNDVGLMTKALVRQLERHPGAPWWAVMDRLLAEWNEPTHTPHSAGPTALIPQVGRRLEKPAMLLPCRRVDAQRWHCPLAKGAGYRVGRRMVLTSSLDVGEQAHGWLEDGDEAMVIREAAGSLLTRHHFAWAMTSSDERHGIVHAWGGQDPERKALVEMLDQYAQLACDAGPTRPQWPPAAVDDGSGAESQPTRTPTIAGFERRDREVVVHDRWGDEVARIDPSDGLLCKAWIERLAAVEDWLTLERVLDDWPDDAFSLRWGPSQDDQRTEWNEPVPTITPQTSLWVELHAQIACMPAFVSLFRLRGDRVVEALQPHVPGGLPVAGRYPMAGLGDGVEPWHLEWPADLEGDGPRTELLVVMVSNRPLPLVRLSRGAVARGTVRVARKPAPPPQDEPPEDARLSMLVRRYRLMRG